jgi:quercetin dioxygenase-like cupin family protein
MVDGEYVLNNSAKPVEMAPGVWRKTLVTTGAMMLVEIIFDQDAVAPMHSHPNKQIGYVVKGQFELTMREDSQVLNPGDSYAVQGDVPHEARAVTDCVVIAVFAPPRERYR